ESCLSQQAAFHERDGTISSRSSLKNPGEGAIPSCAPDGKRGNHQDQTRFVLLHGAGYAGKYIVCVGTYQPDGSHDNDEDYRQHYGILGDVLPLVLQPKFTDQFSHTASLGLRFLGLRSHHYQRATTCQRRISSLPPSLICVFRAVTPRAPG